MLEAVAAVAELRTIGDGGSIPWDHPEDLRRFRDITSGSPLVMGRRTHESILERNGEPLTDAGRSCVVLSRSMAEPGHPDVAVARSIDEAVDLARYRAGGGAAYVAGGESVYRQMFPLCGALNITRVHDVYEGDARFPEWDRSGWDLVSEDHRGEITFLRYERS